MNNTRDKSPKRYPSIAKIVKTIPKPAKRKRGRPPAPIVEFPIPISDTWDEPETFHEALVLHMRRHNDTWYSLHKAIVGPADNLDRKTLRFWINGQKYPRSSQSMEILARTERRYRLPKGYFKTKLSHPSRATHRPKIPGVTLAEQRRLAWHLPDDFADRSREEQGEILEWVRRVVISGATEYRKFQAAAMRHRYAVKFPVLESYKYSPNSSAEDRGNIEPISEVDPELLSGTVAAPTLLSEEMTDLVKFKTSTLTRVGFQRNGVWCDETVSQKIEHLGLLFGALAASPRNAVRGFGVPLRALSFSIFVFPAVWDWYLRWREARRGFYTAWEVDMLRVGLALTRTESGWLRQSPDLAQRLHPIAGLISQSEIDAAKGNWEATCDAFYKYATSRVKEVQRIARVHRDPFEPILAVLEAANPVAEYRKITEEILRLMPDEKRYPRSAAECVRSFLMVRLALHLGVRQKNLRQLLFKRRGELPSSDRYLVDAKRGELRWSDRDNGWEVFIPSVAFKNMNSSFFGNKPFRLLLPDLGNLYSFIDGYLNRHRARLLKGGGDPGTFFVKTAKATTANAAYDQTSFYDAWRLIIQRFGIYNPYTERGAIRGLLPHGPHNVRDVLATHILKLTGSYEQASYAIQDTPDMVAKHYGRFLPQDKTALAAQILNKVWEAA